MVFFSEDKTLYASVRRELSISKGPSLTSSLPNFSVSPQAESAGTSIVAI